jgi:hypothetical protein
MGILLNSRHSGPAFGSKQCGGGSACVGRAPTGPLQYCAAAVEGGTRIISIRAKYKRTKLALYALGCAAFVALGLFLVTEVAQDASYSRHYAALPVGLASLAFFGIGLMVIVARFIDRRDILVIDDRGIRDLRLGINTIPWKDIQSITEYTVKRQTFFAIQVDEPTRYVENSGKRFMLKANRIAGFSPLNVSAHGLGISPDELRRSLSGWLARTRAP